MKNGGQYTKETGRVKFVVFPIGNRAFSRWAAVVGVALIAGCSAQPHPLEGAPAPDVPLPLLDGDGMALSAHKGKRVVVLDFWATWCAPCRHSLPALERAAKKFSPEDVAVYAVNVAESAAQARRFAQSTGLDLPIALDREGHATLAYRAAAMPTTVYIDRAGVIRLVREGAAPDPEAEYTADIRDLLQY